MGSSVKPEKLGKTRLMERLLPKTAGSEIIIVHPEQKLGNTYNAKVLMVEANTLTVNLPRRIAGPGYLRNSADVVVNFVIDNTLFESRAYFKADDGEMREIILRGEIAEATRRHFVRMPVEINTRYVPISDLSLSSGRLPRIDWRKCSARDISGGGILMQAQHPIQSGAYVLLNLDIASFRGQFFVFGHVRWTGLGEVDGMHHQCGVMFIPYEDLTYHFSPRALSWLPPIMQEFDKTVQNELDRFLSNKSSESKGD